jgi:hypothetical protein
VLELAVIGLDRIVRMVFDVMPRRRHQVLEHGRVDRGGIGDHLNRDHLQRRQGSLEEPAGRGGVPASGDQHVDDLPVLVNRPVHVPPDPVDLHIRLIHEPAVTRGVTSEPGRVGQQRNEPLHPPEHSHVVDLDTALDEQLFDVAVGQIEPQVPAHGHDDDLGWEAEPGKR